MNISGNLITYLSISLFALFFAACKDDDNDNSKMIWEENVKMDTKQEIPTVINRTETGTANLKLYEDSTLSFKLSVSNLDATDQLTVAHIHTGGPVDSGSPIILLVDNTTTKFNGSSVSGTVKLNATQFQAIKGNTEGFYVNVHSTKLPVGLVRGQMKLTISYAQNVDLTPISNPLRPETGVAIFRMTNDSTLYYKVTVNNIQQGDVLSTAQVSVGAAGVSGPAIIPLYAASTEYGMPMSIKLTGSQANFLINTPVYVVVSSQMVPGELLRGQIR